MKNGWHYCLHICHTWHDWVCWEVCKLILKNSRLLFQDWKLPLHACIIIQIGNKHLETPYKCCTSNADNFIRQCAWPDQSEDCNCNQLQCCAHYFRGIRQKTRFSIKLNPLVPKDDNNHCCSVMLRKWNDQYICRLIMSKGRAGTFKSWYFATNTVHLIPVQKG